MTDPFVAEVRILACNFAPRGWAFCNGQLLPISQNTALFSLLGTFYGGDGKTTFALPDLQGGVPVHQGQGSGLSEYVLGETGGSQTVTLLQSEMPAHNHTMRAAAQDPANAKAVSGNASWSISQGGGIYQASANTTLAFEAVALTGGGLPHNNLQPYLALNFCIALQGIFPQRS